MARAEITPQGSEGTAHEAIQQVLSSAIIDGDPEFARQVAIRQTSMQPHEIVKFIDAQRQAAEDPAQKELWTDSLVGLLTNYRDSRVVMVNVEVVNSVIDDLVAEGTITV